MGGKFNNKIYYFLFEKLIKFIFFFLQLLHLLIIFFCVYVIEKCDKSEIISVHVIYPDCVK